MAEETSLPQPQDTKKVLIVTGMSGAGKSSALKALEDLGYEAVDNLPLSLLPNVLSLTPAPQPDMAEPRAMALGIDSRTRAFNPEHLLALLDSVAAQPEVDISLLFLDCSTETLVRRFTETRRRHPLAADRPVMDGIARERTLMQPLQERADLVIDTGTLSVHELKRLLTAQFGLDEAGQLTITVTSFSYGKGLPREADIVFDMRFLANPHYDEALRPLSGRDPDVGAFIQADPAFAPFLDSMTRLVLLLLPRYQGEGKAYLTIAFGCTGGRHRSVFMAEKLRGVLAEHGYEAGIIHRDAGLE